MEDLIESASRGTDRSLDGLEHSVDYWPLMMELVSHGRLSHVAQLLGPHSRFARLSQQQPALGREFLEILSSHPYAELVDSEDGPVTAESGLRDVARRLLDWQERASRLQTRWETAAQSVGAVVPELSHLLKILRGDEHALLEESRGSYTRYLLLLLLYKYAPTLSGSDLHSLVRHSLQMCGRVGNDGAVIQYSSSDQADTEQDGMAGVLLACLRGDAGAILRQTYETGIQARDSVPSTASVATQCCVHLGELLVRAGVASEITGPLSTRDGASFLEEVKLQLAEVLNDQMYPIEVSRVVSPSIPMIY